MTKETQNKIVGFIYEQFLGGFTTLSDGHEDNRFAVVIDNGERLKKQTIKNILEFSDKEGYDIEIHTQQADKEKVASLVLLFIRNKL
jgi:hypothetical protein